MPGFIERQIQTLADYQKLRSRNKRDGAVGISAEPESQRDFVRKFGDKVKNVRYTHRADYVGLTVLGKNTGFIITINDKQERKLRLINVVDGKMKITNRYLRLKDAQSCCNLQRGLLAWVQ